MSNDVNRGLKSRYRYYEPICTSSRPLDMAYDPNFIYSSRVDQCRDARREAHKLSQRRRWKRRPCNYECLLDKSVQELNRTVTLGDSEYGADKEKTSQFYYTKPLEKPPTPLQVKIERENEFYISAVTHQEGQNHSCGIQTLYRDSEVQTDIWQPPDFQVTCWDPYPEILLIAQLGWQLGFEPSMLEVKIIKRMRIRRAWEKCLPSVIDEKSREESTRIFNSLQTAEWHLREEFIAALIALRLELAENELEGFTEKRECQLMERLNRYYHKKKSHNKLVLFNMEMAHSRSIRRADPKKNRHVKDDPIKQHANRTSETYVHLKREGYLGKHRNLEIGEEISSRLAASTPKKLDELMSKYYKPLAVKKDCKQPQNWELCIRYSKYTEEKLESLVSELKNKRIFKKSREPDSILEYDRVVWPKIDPEARPMTPDPAKGVDEYTEERYQAAIVLQKMIRGRTVQETMCTGRRDCAELIEEFRCTHALHKIGFERLSRHRLALVNKQRSALIVETQRLFSEGILWDLAGQTISRALDFLSKELERLLDERNIHAHTLLAERARFDLECIESKRRQRELARRREQDAMFMQIMKVTQDSVDLYLQNFITESSEWASAREIRHQIQADAQRIDEAASASLSASQDHIVYEQIAELVHSFVLPEAIKTRVRKSHADRQKLYLKVAHEYVYGDMDEEDLRNALKYKLKEEPVKEEEVERPNSVEDLKDYLDERLRSEDFTFEREESEGSYENYVARIKARLREKNYTHYDYLRSLRQYSFDKSELEILKHLNLLKPKEEKKKGGGYEDLESPPKSYDESGDSEKVLRVFDFSKDFEGQFNKENKNVGFHNVESDEQFLKKDENE